MRMLLLIIMAMVLSIRPAAASCTRIYSGVKLDTLSPGVVKRTLLSINFLREKVDTVFEESLKSALRRNLQNASFVFYGRVNSYSTIGFSDQTYSATVSVEALKVYKGNISTGPYTFYDSLVNNVCGIPNYGNLTGVTFLNFSNTFSTRKDLYLEPNYFDYLEGKSGFVVQGGRISEQNRFTGVSIPFQEFEQMQTTQVGKHAKRIGATGEKRNWINSGAKTGFAPPNRTNRFYDLKGKEADLSVRKSFQ